MSETPGLLVHAQLTHIPCDSHTQDNLLIVDICAGFNINRREIHLVEVEYFQDTEPGGL